MTEDSRDVAAVPLIAVDAGTAAAAFNAAYENYVVPISFTAESFARRMRADSVDPGSSLVYFADKRPAGLLLVARRGRTSRIAAVGFAPALRGLGLGRRTLDTALADARARGDERMLLEVITGNEPAVALYRKAGFAVRRSLAGFRVAADGEAGPDDSEIVDPGLEAARGMLAAFADHDLPWQMQPACFVAPGPTVKALALADAAVALVDEAAGGTRLLTLAVDPARRRRGLGRRLLQAVAARHAAVSIVAVVPEQPGTALFASAGWTRTEIGQYEMEHRFGDGA